MPSSEETGRNMSGRNMEEALLSGFGRVSEPTNWADERSPEPHAGFSGVRKCKLCTRRHGRARGTRRRQPALLAAQAVGAAYSLSVFGTCGRMTRVACGPPW